MTVIVMTMTDGSRRIQYNFRPYTAFASELILSLAKKAAEEVLGAKPEEILKGGHKGRR
jgi:hypothetical protein